MIDYVLNVASKGQVGIGNQNTLASALEQFELMYANHAAREDTIVFPAWKKALGTHAVEEMGEKFEDIEKAQFGGDENVSFFGLAYPTRSVVARLMNGDLWIYESKDKAPHTPTVAELARQAKEDEWRFRFKSESTHKFYRTWDYSPSGRLTLEIFDPKQGWGLIL